jgi:propanol-preferring alcohol dehydrogenase
MVASLEASGLRPGQWAVFPGGGGGVGIQGVQIAKAMGLRPIVIDTSETKKKLALEMGAEVFIDFKEVSNVVEEVKNITDGIGAHGVFVTAVQAYAQATDLVGDRVGGKVMCLGLPAGGSVQVTAEPSWFVLKNRSITGTLVGTHEDARKALDYAKRGLLKQVCEVYPIDKIAEAVDKLRKGQVAGRVVVDFNQ